MILKLILHVNVRTNTSINPNNRISMNSPDHNSIDISSNSGIGVDITLHCWFNLAQVSVLPVILFYIFMIVRVVIPISIE